MMGVFINYKSFWVRDFINAVLLVVIHILYTQKWAIGHTVPGATTRTWTFTNCKSINTYRRQNKSE
ncbi:hypothetical protein HMPREF1634_07935 [Tissierellia bacterium S7-1-4]|nr:hypothetical protein HMPREF1634_07935 [Tissierellia bacterium S7-1-4]